uniref:Uncharacterized protein n=1 Tax=Arundo donax TaxID=35708 RepID=A0A0A9GV49_ARUDO
MESTTHSSTWLKRKTWRKFIGSAPLS